MIGFQILDQILRGEDPRTTAPDGTRTFPIGVLLRVNLLLAASYGVCMGVYGLFRPVDPEFRQMISSAIKLPALFGLTLVVTFPSLYVFNTLLGSRARFGELLALIVAGLSVLVCVLAAFGPIVAFFSVSTTSYPFILLLNVAVLALAGTFGAGYLHRALTQTAPVVNPPSPTPTDSALPVARVVPYTNPANSVFYIWMLVFGLVGGQMSWVLRPFVGSPNMPFAWFRPREGSFFEGVMQSLRAIIGG